MERVITYIDGFNLYFGLKSANLHRYFWLDLHKLSSNLLKKSQQLIRTKYFTARINGPSDKQKRQSTYIEAIAGLSDTDIHVSGTVLFKSCHVSGTVLFKSCIRHAKLV